MPGIPTMKTAKPGDVLVFDCGHGGATGRIDILDVTADGTFEVVIREGDFSCATFMDNLPLVSTVDKTDLDGSGIEQGSTFAVYDHDDPLINADHAARARAIATRDDR